MYRDVAIVDVLMLDTNGGGPLPHRVGFAMVCPRLGNLFNDVAALTRNIGC